MKELFILRGLPGAGKSTIAGLLGGVVCEADDYFRDKHGNYNYDAEKKGEAHAFCRGKADLAMQLGLARVVVSNTATTEFEFKSYVDMAEQYGYRAHFLIVENRHGHQNDKNIRTPILEKMKRRFQIELGSTVTTADRKESYDKYEY